MNRFVVVLAALLATPALADKGNDPFFDVQSSTLWRVTGVFPSKEHNHGYGCVLSTQWADKSVLGFVHDIETGSIGLEITYNDLEFKGDDGDEFEGRFIFNKANGAKKEFSMNYTRHTAHDMSISNIDASVFVEPFVKFNTLTIKLADGSGFRLNLDGTAAAMEHMKACWEEAKKYRNSQDM